MKLSFWATAASAAVLSLFATAAQAEEYTFALSWEPGFCTYGPGVGREECSPAHGKEFAATNLSLHGLWPQSGDYCGVSAEAQGEDEAHHWDKLTPVDYKNPTVKTELAKTMPGIASLLDRHEWTKHGTCSETSADGYFGKASQMTEAAAGLEIGKLLTANAGKTVTRAQFCTALVKDFGQDILKKGKVSAQSVKGGKLVLMQISFNLKGDAVDKLSLTAASLGADMPKPINCSATDQVLIPAFPQ